MTAGDNWRDIKYKEIFEQETEGLIRRRQSDPNCKIEDLEATLRNLYIWDGADLDGRGVVAQTILSATIAAYEEFITNWRSAL